MAKFLDKLRKHNSLMLLLVGLVVILVSIFPLLGGDYIRTHDLNLYPTWLYEFDQGIQDGHLLPRWSADFWVGFGSPLFNFIQPLFYYISELFHLIGFGLVTSIKIVVALGFVAGFLFMYLFGKAVWGRQAGFISAVVYTLFPYRLGLVYIRGDFAEFLATAFIPLILFSFLRLGQTGKLKFFLLGSLSFALLLLSHNIQTIFFLPVLLLYLGIIFWPQIKKIVVPTILSLVLGLGMAAFFTLPAFFERKYLKLSELATGSYNFREYFLNIWDLVLPKWSSYDFFQIGGVGIIILGFTLFVILKRRKELTELQKKTVYFFIIVIAVSSLLTFSLSTWFWEYVPLAKFIQFPWRVLSFQALAFGMLGGLLLRKEMSHLFFKGKLSAKWVIVVFSAAIILVNIIFIKPVSYLQVENDADYYPLQQFFSEANIKSGSYEDSKVTINVYSILPAVVPRDVNMEILREKTKDFTAQVAVGGKNPDEFKIEVLQGEIQWKIQKSESYLLDVVLTVTEKGTIRVNQFWFPGWQAYLDDKQVAINHDNDWQAMDFEISPGSHQLQLHFTNTAIRTISEIISLISFGLWCMLFIFYKRCLLSNFDNCYRIGRNMGEST